MPRSQVTTTEFNSVNIQDGSIVNADINASAAVAVSKLAAGTSAQVLLNNATPTPTWTSLSGDVTVGATGTTAIGAGKVTQAMDVANSRDDTIVANVADSNVLGGIHVIFRKNVSAGITADLDVTVTNKIRVIDAWLVKTNGAGGGAGSIQVKNGTSAVTDAMSIDVADTTITRATQINDANHEIAAGGTLRFTRTRTASTDETCVVYVEAIRVV